MNDMCHMSCDEQLVNDVSHDRITKYFLVPSCGKAL